MILINEHDFDEINPKCMFVCGMKNIEEINRLFIIQSINQSDSIKNYHYKSSPWFNFHTENAFVSFFAILGYIIIPKQKLTNSVSFVLLQLNYNVDDRTIQKKFFVSIDISEIPALFFNFSFQIQLSFVF